MAFAFEIYFDNRTGKKMIFISTDNGASGAEYPYETFEDIGKAVTTYLTDYYPEVIKI